MNKIDFLPLNVKPSVCLSVRLSLCIAMVPFLFGCHYFLFLEQLYTGTAKWEHSHFRTILQKTRKRKA